MAQNQNEKSYLVLDQYRESSEYNDFIGKYYHFPSKHLSLLSQPDIEFIYYEPKKNGEGVYHGFGKIIKPPFKDKRADGFYFVEISNYKPFSKPVPFEDADGPRETAPYYNPQNAVRRTTIEILEGICLDGGIMLGFNADAHLLRVLGEELIATEKVGILELVKNSYDARATRCKIRIENVPTLKTDDQNKLLHPELSGPVISIEDNGIGMDLHTIEFGWLRPAATIKTSIKERLRKEREQAIQDDRLGTYEGLVEKLKKQHGGRIPLGEKGVGRFATRRLGRHLELRTKTKGIDYEYVLRINWDEFDQSNPEQPTDLDSIGVSLFRDKETKIFKASESGTRILVFGGREGFELTDDAIRDINRTLLQLKSPNKAPAGFDVVFECPQITDLDMTLITDEFDAAFTVDGIVDLNGHCDLELQFTPPKSIPLLPEKMDKRQWDLKNGEGQQEYWKGRLPKCGPFFIHLKIWYRTAPWVEGPKLRDLTDYLDRFGGVGIYRDGLSVFSSDVGSKLDWLDLSVSHIKSGARMSYYNLLGSIDLEQGQNFQLIDKTNREGLLKNAAFEDLVFLVKAIMDLLQIEFKGKRDKFSDLTNDVVRDPRKLEDVTKQASSVLLTLADSSYDLHKDPYGLVKGIKKDEEKKDYLINLAKSVKKLQKSLEAIEEVQSLLTEQAGYGIAVAISVHEISKLATDFYEKAISFVRKGKISNDLVSDFELAAKAIKTELKRLGPLRAVRTENKVVFNVNKSIEFAVAVHRRRLEQAKIEIVFDSKKGFDIYARFGALNQVFSNLISNSRYWLKSPNQKEKQISIEVDSLDRCIFVRDNGSGIDESILPYLFQPGYSLKRPPSGMGLYICKYYMSDMKGDIYLARGKELNASIPGAQFVLDFHRVPTKGV